MLEVNEAVFKNKILIISQAPVQCVSGKLRKDSVEQAAYVAGAVGIKLDV